MKLNVLLATTDVLRTKFKGMVNDYTIFFNKSGGAFLGSKATYEPREGTVDEPSKRGVRRLVTTVDEKINYFVNESKGFVDALFSQEKTNALGDAQADLVVNGTNWGTFTSLELLRLKSLLEAGDLGNLEKMIEVIPVRKEDAIWKISEDPEYTEREGIWESPLLRGVQKTTEKEQYILQDPNVMSGNAKSYTPQIGVRNITRELGAYSAQVFSGEWSHVQRAGVLKRRSDLIVAVVKALKECNECEAEKSTLTAEKIFNYLFDRN
jgi:hypothetical protein